jgi:hypothetical protein
MPMTVIATSMLSIRIDNNLDKGSDKNAAIAQ